MANGEGSPGYGERTGFSLNVSRSGFIWEANMKKQFVTKLLVSFLASASILGGAAVPAYAAAPAAVETQKSNGTGLTDDALYLATYFGFATGSTTDAPTFNACLRNILANESEYADGETPYPAVTGSVSWNNVLPVLLQAADFSEFADTYPDSKVSSRLSKAGIGVPGDLVLAREIAAAVDANLITVQQGKAAAAGTSMSADDINSVLMAVADATGNGRNYLGMSNDPAIYSKLDAAWHSFVLYDNQDLTKLGTTLLNQKNITGFNLKDDACNARFIENLTITYSHDNIEHAKQLVALLNSENLTAKVALEPKVSSYEYLLDWGPVPAPTPTYEVRKAADHFYVVYSMEYDLKLEFVNQTDLNAFNQVILSYAKKTSSNSDCKGMIKKAWWQPCYTTTNPLMAADSQYKPVTDMNIQSDGFTLKTFVTTDDTAKVEAAANKLIHSSSIRLQPVTRYCNNAFYNYLTGTDYQ